MIITTVLQTLLERLELGRTLPDAIAAPRVSQRNGATTHRRAGVHADRGAGARGALRARLRAPQAEIGATTGIEFFDRGKMLAAAEPVRRGGGTALVVKPQR